MWTEKYGVETGLLNAQNYKYEKSNLFIFFYFYLGQHAGRKLAEKPLCARVECTFCYTINLTENDLRETEIVELPSPYVWIRMPMALVAAPITNEQKRTRSASNTLGSFH